MKDDKTKEEFIHELEKLRQRIKELEMMEKKLKEGEELFKTLFEEAPDPLFMYTPEGELIDGNKAAEKLIGYKREELIGKNMLKTGLLPKKFIPHVKKVLQKNANGERTGPDEVEVICRDGKRIWVEINSLPLRIGGKRMVLGIARDITQRKKMEEELKESEERYRAIFENTGTATVVIEEDTTLSLVNSEFEKLSGYSKEEIEGKKSWTEFVAKEDLERMKKYHRNRRKNPGTAPKNYEFRFVNRKGNVKDIFLTIDMIPGTKKSIASLLDITKQKRARKKIKHLNMVLRAIRGVNQVITKEKNRDRLLQGICNKLVQSRGYSSSWIVLLEDKKLIASAEAGLGKEFISFKKMLEKGELSECCKKALNKSNVVVIKDSSMCNDCPLSGKEPGDTAMAIQLRHEGRTYGVMAVSIPEEFASDKEEQNLFAEVAGDIALALHTMEVEEALKEEEELRKAILFASPVGIGFTINRVLGWANEAMYKMVGYSPEETLGNSARMLYESNEEYERVGREMEKAFKKGEVAKIETKWRRKDGSTFDCSLYLHPINKEKPEEGVVVIAVDITERKKMERELKKAFEEVEKALKKEREFKLRAAHYFFNPIAIAKGYLDLVMEDVPEGQREKLKAAENAIERVEKVVKNVTQRGEIRE